MYTARFSRTGSPPKNWEDLNQYFRTNPWLINEKLRAAAATTVAGLVATERVVAFVTEYCSYCKGLQRLLDTSGVDYTAHCIDPADDPSGIAKREALTNLSGKCTTPDGGHATCCVHGVRLCWCAHDLVLPEMMMCKTSAFNFLADVYHLSILLFLGGGCALLSCHGAQLCVSAVLRMALCICAPVHHSPAGCFTVPQLFVDGTFVGGFSDVKSAWKEGSLRSMLGIPTSHI